MPELRISFAAPAFNEEACVESMVRECLSTLDDHGLAGEVVIADDGSTDATASILARLAAEDARVRPVTLPRNRGYGAAMQAALAAARGEWIATLDADGQFDPADAVRLLEHCRSGGWDGMNGIRTKSDTPLRVFADAGLRRTVRVLFGLSLRDPNCALKVLPRAWVQASRFEAPGYAFPTEVVVRAAAGGLALGEAPIAHRPRAGGETKLSVARAAARTLWFLVRLRARGLVVTSPKRGNR